MKTIACVLHTTPFYNREHKVEYTPEHVRWLKRQVEKCCMVPHRFVCFSNVEIEGVEVIPLKHDWPGWWSKLEMFAHLQEAFYMDLDTVLVGPIDDLVHHTPAGMMALESMTRVPDLRLNSGILSWKGDFRFLYENFQSNPEAIMGRYTEVRRWGDQGYIQDQLEARVQAFEILQRKFPGQVVSFKADLRRGNPKPGNRIVCFHGQPKPEHVKAVHSWIPS